MTENIERTQEKNFSARYIAKIAIFASLATVLYLWVKFPLPFLFPSFLEVNFSDLPALIGGFALGPVAGVIIVVIKILIKLPFSTSMCVGELSDLINGIAFILPACLIYKRNKSKKSALLGLIIGSVCSVICSMFSNRFLIIPFYIEVFHLNMQTLANMCAVIPGITAENFYLYYIFIAVLPFNILRCFLVSVITFFVYKRVSNLLRKF